ncbi:phosphoglycerate mutase 2 [Teleopsis dalmanni]|uniref:phosphoglycerate mutase 2 n=1 Tax=Teleopsis dalmanni TaxID=139649 RepID=UPI0018CF7CE6|nr:phosphoglycerate mutase 2 [Teleopsis dalmanni]XP_037955800.1 phosphoglycerate mutase 2 [Teleopsis dalmanni]XP_037955801.1 phosphoglycerate mutase 2 [Teleopsis dalmanni]
MKTISMVLIRHGESTFNQKNLFCGWHDAELSENGIRDASKISSAALMEHKMAFDVAYTSALKRAQDTLKIILKEIGCPDLPTKCDWRLNERHYGNLIGFNKRQMADKYGEEQVQIWRRSFDVLPPPITSDNPYYECIRSNPSFRDIPPEQFPLSESLKTTMGRVIPYWEQEILPQIHAGKRVLIVAHGTIARALAKHIENISDENIKSVNIPNSIPCVYEFDLEKKNLVGKIKYLADENFLNKQMEKTASIGN